MTKKCRSRSAISSIREILEKYDPEVLRFFILRAHYRSPLNYSDRHLDDARQALSRLYTALKTVPGAIVAIDWNERHAQGFRKAMDDDFNTPEACALLFDLAAEVNRSHSSQLASQLRSLAGLLGLLQRDPQVFLQATPVDGGEISAARIESLLAERMAAKQRRDFAAADGIRNQLRAAGIVVEDGAGGSTWRRA